MSQAQHEGEAEHGLDVFEDLAGIADGEAGVGRPVGALAAVEAGDAAAKLAFDVYIHRLAFYIGGYMALLGGVEALAFTAGVGENDDTVRAAVCARLHDLGFHLDPDANRLRSSNARIVSMDGSPVTICVVPTNEELQMAREVKDALEGAS